MTSTNRFSYNMGDFEAEVELVLESPHAAKLWRGRPYDPFTELRSIIGIDGYFTAVHRIVRAAKADDPYADWWLMCLENRIDLSQQSLNHVLAQVKERLVQLPPELKVIEFKNHAPFRTPIFVDTALGFAGLYQLIAFDRLAKELEKASLLAMIDTSERSEWGRFAARAVRGLFYYAQRYRFTGVARKDFREMNANARRALARYEEIPQGVIEGRARAKFAPHTWRAMPERKTAARSQTFEELLARDESESAKDDQAMLNDMDFVNNADEMPSPDEFVSLEDVLREDALDQDEPA
ncbi:MAG: TIGR03761 family integrating conjugative element protein [Proteobacteria bacterium]|nr:TIGR03761 family integrating conjugative element protein [Pseudomonadota bacterium]MCL2590577.1 TIGR03761 family integrating conjugative element protein [Betaproteobacteria bacterium]